MYQKKVNYRRQLITTKRSKREVEGDFRDELCSLAGGAIGEFERRDLREEAVVCARIW